MSLVEPTARPPGAIAAGTTGRRQVAAAAFFTWRLAIVSLVLMVWLVPIRRYRFPISLPFNLEPYRLMVLTLLALLIVAFLIGRLRLSASGHGRALALVAGAAIAAQIVNARRIEDAELTTQALKSLSYFLSTVLAFVLVSAMVESVEDVEKVVAAFAVGAVIVALAALWESRTRTNLFGNLDAWIPALEDTREDNVNTRGGRLRVRASAQHPIALGAALAMTVPLAFFLARRAATMARRRLWLLGALVIAAGAVGTVSRTVILMFTAMGVVALVLRGRSMVRYWPLLLVLAVGAQLAAPGSVRQLYRAFTPEEGLVSQQTGREGYGGSGRVADLRPAFDRWSEYPIFGRGLGTGRETSEPAALAALDESVEAFIIYDNQYLYSLVTVGAVGFIGVLWLVWGAVVKLFRSAKAAVDRLGDLLVALTISCVGFGVGMLTFDAFAFTQVTVLFFIVAALGLKTRELTKS